MAIRGRRQQDRRGPRALVLDSPTPLETRQLMAASPLGFALPDLTVDGYAGPAATYGGPIAVTVSVRNLGVTSQIEPFAIAPGAVSSADAGAFNVGVYLSKGPVLKKRNSVLIGTIRFDGLTQNNEKTVTSEFTLPSRPAGFPRLGRDVFLTFVVDSNQQIREVTKENNVSTPTAVRLAPALPQLEAVSLTLPATMRPGDTIQPTIEIANFGTVDTSLQGPLTVQLVASLDANFGPGDSVISTFTIDNVEPVSVAPTQNLVLGDDRIDLPANVRVAMGAPVTLPTSPSTYFIGLRIDPNNAIRQLSTRGAALEQIRQVGPNSAGLPPAGVLSAASSTSNLFPIPAFGPLTTTNPVVIQHPNLYYEIAASPRAGRLHAQRVNVARARKAGRS